MLAVELKRLMTPPSVIVPVPARRSSIRKRGWDQMELICTHLHLKHGLPTALLLKRSGSASQKQLTYKQRMRNLSGHIQIRRNHEKLPEEVLLIDDVYTTGATLNECARVLKEQTSVRISAITIAIAPY